MDIKEIHCPVPQEISVCNSSREGNRSSRGLRGPRGSWCSPHPSTQSRNSNTSRTSFHTPEIGGFNDHPEPNAAAATHRRSDFPLSPILCNRKRYSRTDPMIHGKIVYPSDHHVEFKAEDSEPDNCPSDISDSVIAENLPRQTATTRKDLKRVLGAASALTQLRKSHEERSVTGKRSVTSKKSVASRKSESTRSSSKSDKTRKSRLRQNHTSKHQVGEDLEFNTYKEESCYSQPSNDCLHKFPQKTAFEDDERFCYKDGLIMLGSSSRKLEDENTITYKFGDLKLKDDIDIDTYRNSLNPSSHASQEHLKFSPKAIRRDSPPLVSSQAALDDDSRFASEDGFFVLCSNSPRQQRPCDIDDTTTGDDSLKDNTLSTLSQSFPSRMSGSPKTRSSSKISFDNDTQLVLENGFFVLQTKPNGTNVSSDVTPKSQFERYSPISRDSHSPVRPKTSTRDENAIIEKYCNNSEQEDDISFKQYLRISLDKFDHGTINR